MTRTMTIRLATPAHEMAQEEIQKQVAYLSRRIARPRFAQGGAVLEFDVPEESTDELTAPQQVLVDRCIAAALPDASERVRASCAALHRYQLAPTEGDLTTLLRFQPEIRSP